MRRVHATVTGTVQGVWFRQSTKQEADKLGLTGWVMNLHDGSVELEAQGDADAVGDLLMWCNRGPDKARVKGLKFTDIEPDEDEESFEVLRDDA